MTNSDNPFDNTGIHKLPRFFDKTPKDIGRWLNELCCTLENGEKAHPQHIKSLRYTVDKINEGASLNEAFGIAPRPGSPYKLSEEAQIAIATLIGYGRISKSDAETAREGFENYRTLANKFNVDPDTISLFVKQMEPLIRALNDYIEKD